MQTDEQRVEELRIDLANAKKTCMACKKEQDASCFDCGVHYNLEDWHVELEFLNKEID